MLVPKFPPNYLIVFDSTPIILHKVINLKLWHKNVQIQDQIIIMEDITKIASLHSVWIQRLSPK